MNSSKLLQWLPTTKSCSCSKNALNCLSERAWLRNQVPIWYFTTKQLNTKFDSISRQQHPAVFPTVLAKRIIENYTHTNETVLDIFSGVGTTLHAAQLLSRNAIGLELNKKFYEFTKKRLRLTPIDGSSRHELAQRKTKNGQKIVQLNADARDILEYIPIDSIDLVFTSPPYWDMLKQQPSRRNLKNKRFLKENYSTDPNDLSNEPTLQQFMENIKDIFGKLHQVLKPNGRVVINTGDYRRKGSFIPLSATYINILKDQTFELKNIIIWDRRKEYDIGIFSHPNNFIVNNGMFEYLLEFKK